MDGIELGKLEEANRRYADERLIKQVAELQAEVKQSKEKLDKLNGYYVGTVEKLQNMEAKVEQSKEELEIANAEVKRLKREKEMAYKEGEISGLKQAAAIIKETNAKS